MKNIRVYLRSFIDQLFDSPCCLLCQQPSQRSFPLCLGCERDLPWLNHYCQHCAEPLPDLPSTPALEQPQREQPPVEQPQKERPASLSCGHCIKHPPAFTHTYAPLRYEFPVDRLIQRFKQRADYHNIELFSRLFAQQLPVATPEQPLPQQLIPVPLHPHRLRQRGFNQSLELAHSIGTRLSIQINAKACSRVLDTPHQQGLSAKQRRRNLRHAFRVNADQLDLNGRRHVALIDDVMTTGSTAQVLALALRRAGIEQVDIWCLARTPADRHSSEFAAIKSQTQP